MTPPTSTVRIVATSALAFGLASALSACDPKPPEPKAMPDATTTSPTMPVPSASAPASQ